MSKIDPGAVGKPDPVLLNNKKVYQLWFRRGNNIPEMVIFPFDGNLQAAINRGRDFCDKTQFKFCGVKPCLVDLDALEKLELAPEGVI
jgi:hypothetical protein